MRLPHMTQGACLLSAAPRGALTRCLCLQPCGIAESCGLPEPCSVPKPCGIAKPCGSLATKSCGLSITHKQVQPGCACSIAACSASRRAMPAQTVDARRTLRLACTSAACSLHCSSPLSRPAQGLHRKHRTRSSDTQELTCLLLVQPITNDAKHASRLHSCSRQPVRRCRGPVQQRGWLSHALLGRTVGGRSVPSRQQLHARRLQHVDVHVGQHGNGGTATAPALVITPSFSQNPVQPVCPIRGPESASQQLQHSGPQSFDFSNA